MKHVEKKIAQKDIHSSWLDLERIMLARHGEEIWDLMRQGMMSAYYMGAAAAAMSSLSRKSQLSQASNGLSEAMGRPMTLIPDASAPR